MPDVFVTDGEEEVADFFDGSGAAPTNWFVDWGTGVTGAVKADSALETPAPEARQIMTESQPTASQNQLVGTIVATAARAITEMGVFDLVTGSRMVIRSTFAVINVATDDSIKFTVTITWA